MSDGESVTQWLHGIKAGEGADIQRLWDRYFQRLVRLAGTKLPGHCRRAFDEEDVAISAFQSFCDRAGQGQFPRLNDRDDLWRLLATLTVAQGGDDDAPPDPPEAGWGPGARRVGLSDAGRERPRPAMVSSKMLGNEPTPDAAARFADAFEQLMK